MATLVVFVANAQKQPVAVKGGYQIDVQTSAICEMCKETLEYDLAFEKGVKSSDLNLENKVISVVYNPKKTTAEEIRTRISKVGYHADDIQRDAEAYEKLPDCCKDGAHGSPTEQKAHHH
ncbi:MAG: heavy-metal-associated domain-containing protein [Cyclobacteriaceae bacterium]